MGTLDGKVAFITGAARGLGRAYAIKLASEGADIIAVDICQEFATTDYPGSTPEDLTRTEQLVQARGRTILSRHADVRDRDAVDAVVREAVDHFGRLDIVIANAGIIRLTDSDEPDATFRDILERQLDRCLEHGRSRDSRSGRR